MAFTGIFWKYHTGVKPLQPLMLHKAKNEYILHIAEEAERKKCFANEQKQCCQWNMGHQYRHSY